MALFFKKRTAAKSPAYEAVKAPIKTNTNPYEAKKEPAYETVKKPIKNPSKKEVPYEAKKPSTKGDSPYEAKKPSKGNSNTYKA